MKLEIETFQVCLGEDLNDPNPTVFIRGLRTFEDAETVRNRLLEMQTANQLDSSLVAGKTFYVRLSPGRQEMTIPLQDLASVQQALQSGRFSVPIFARTTLDDGTSPVYIRIKPVLSTSLL